MKTFCRLEIVKNSPSFLVGLNHNAIYTYTVGSGMLTDKNLKSASLSKMKVSLRLEAIILISLHAKAYLKLPVFTIQ